MEIYKYPRTHHIEGSGFQPGDEDLKSIPFMAIAQKHVVVAEKMDGANCAISFSGIGKLMLQSRGHYLVGGPREKHFDLFKTWSHTYTNELQRLLTDRFVMYGEWLYAKHTIFYDQLPHYFMEFDIFDKKQKTFLSTPLRQQLLKPFSFIKSVKILFEGRLDHLNQLKELQTKSSFITENHLVTLGQLCNRENLDHERVLSETDRSNLMEGLYIKVEDENNVTGRYKFIRADFLTTVIDSNSHWLSRPIIPNQLRPGINLFNQHHT